MSFRSVVVVALAVALSACGNNRDSGPSFVFTRPEQLDFVCFAPKVQSPSEFVVVPRSCCATYDPSSASSPPAPSPACTREFTYDGVDTGQLLGASYLHALVSQSTRGEVAAIDLVNERVLDSDRLIPGYTFLDSGGLPRALVAPARQPGSGPERGPAWTFIASAENRQVRAIATCRFRSGGRCGPELAPGNADSTLLDLQTRVPLPAPPADMVLGPDGALWVTLPSIGALARVALSEQGNLPFTLDAAGGAPALPRFFYVRSAPSAQAPEPVAEAGAYAAVCGLGSAYVPTTRALPLAPRTEAGVAVQPTRVRFDAESGLLLVADGLAPVLHVFAPGTDGSLIALEALPTGTPIVDFVLTPQVPTLAPPDLLTPPLPDPSAPTRRYLYAIDARNDGLVALFDFAVSAPGTRPILTPLLAPVRGQRYADRLDLATPAATLEVIDTRVRSSYACGEQSDADLAQQRDQLRAATSQAEVEQRARAVSRLTVSEDATSEQLRGVFLVAAAKSGLLSVLDVQDLDLACRARAQCRPLTCSDPAQCPPGNLDAAADPEARAAVAVRRHAVRRRTAGTLSATLTTGSAFAPSVCGPDSVQTLPAPGAGDALVCVPRDPWSTYSDVWNIRYQGALPGSALRAGAFEPGPSADLLTVRAPVGTNLCTRGVLAQDLVAVIGEPAEWLESQCGTPSLTDAPLLTIEQAFSDHLVVRAREGDPAAVYAQLRTCYPDAVGFELRAKDFLVYGNGLYLHRVTTGPDGACIEDTTKDPRLTARPVLDAGNWRYENPFVTFTIRAFNQGEATTARDTTVQVYDAATAVTENNVADSRYGDALPAEIRYLSEVGDLFVLDTASQGLRRYTLQPFENDGSIYQ